MGILQAAFLLSGIGLLLLREKIASKKGKLSFESASSKPLLNRTGSVIALQSQIQTPVWGKQGFLAGVLLCNSGPP